MNSTLIKISYKELIDRYNILIRKFSLIHPLILKKYENEINQLVDKIETHVSDELCSDDKFFILSLRKLIYKLESVLSIDVTNEYNRIINNNLSSTYSTDAIQTSSFSTKQVLDQDGNPNIVWDSVQQFLKEKLNVHTYNVWVKPVKFHSFMDNVINISVQNSYFKNWLEEHCSSMIKDHLGELNVDYDVKFITA